MEQTLSTSRALVAAGTARMSLVCPHCKVGGQSVVGHYVTVSIGWDAEGGYWHCLICGFVGFGSDFTLLRFPIVASVGRRPRLPGERPWRRRTGCEGTCR